MINSHFIGREPYSNHSFNPSSPTVSLAVHQFVELLRGERAVQAPANFFKVEAVRAEEHYCLHCLKVQTFDVIYGTSNKMPVFEIDLGMDVNFRIKRCRGCEKESVR